MANTFVSSLLRRGSRGSDVLELQRYLGVRAIGVFDRETERAVRAFQRLHDLVNDGIVGPKTRSAMSHGSSIGSVTSHRDLSEPWALQGGDMRGPLHTRSPGFHIEPLTPPAPIPGLTTRLHIDQPLTLRTHDWDTSPRTRAAPPRRPTKPPDRPAGGYRQKYAGPVPANAVPASPERMGVQPGADVPAWPGPDAAVGPLYRHALKDLKSSTPVVFWSGGNIAAARAEKVARRKGGMTLEMTPAGRRLARLQASGAPVTLEDWVEASKQFARKAGLLGQPASSVVRVPQRAGNVRTEVELPTYARWRTIGRTTRGATTALGLIGVLPAGVALSDRLQGRVELRVKGLDPDSFDVGHVLHNVTIDGVGVMVRVERNIPWIGRKRFYAVAFEG